MGLDVVRGIRLALAAQDLGLLRDGVVPHQRRLEQRPVIAYALRAVAAEGLKRELPRAQAVPTGMVISRVTGHTGASGSSGKGPGAAAVPGRARA